MSNYWGKKKTPAQEDDDVEQLLRAAQDDALLKLSVNSHMARATSSAAIDPDLDRRLQALRRNPQKSTTNITPPVKPNPKKSDKVVTRNVDSKAVAEGAEDDDLFARFAALKGTLPVYGKVGNGSDGLVDVGSSNQGGGEESEDEVEKVIKWAIDAARLDPSTPSDDDDNEEKDDESEDDDDDIVVDSRKKGKKK